MPAVGGIRNVTLYCCDPDDMPFDFLSVFSNTLRNRRGFTLWSSIYLNNVTSHCCPLDPCNFEAVRLILHELCHVESFRESPIGFPLIYLIRLIRYGYRQHPDEIAAENRAIALRNQYQRDNPCHCGTTATSATPAPARVLTPTEIETCCGSAQNQDPKIEFSTSRSDVPPTSTRITIVVTARQDCGVRSLTASPVEIIAGVEHPLPTQTSPGTDCLSYRTLTVTRDIRSGTNLKVTASATSCCGKTGVNTIVVGP